MTWLKTFATAIFGGKQETLPDRRKLSLTGFYWQVSGVTALASSRGFSQKVVGESFYRAEIEEVVGGATTHGVTLAIAAVLSPAIYKGDPAIDVLLGGKKCGSIPKAEVPALLNELYEVSSSGIASAKARVRAGFEGGDYCIELNIKRPLAAKIA
ncbi:hypothetical protein [Sphingomonas sp. Leaf23]|uniref:hypothetical protein n=1 Tax=Sphingomonas sp. Leaf23 TaxID=1735689 RepID=UPI0012E323BF|nr:hypothetical protein [Sphingomonas sp. Leaf23]